jgi:hypothetical protein
MKANFLIPGHGKLVHADRQRLQTCHVTVSVRIVRYNYSLSCLSKRPSNASVMEFIYCTTVSGPQNNQPASLQLHHPAKTSLVSAYLTQSQIVL